MVNVPPRVNGAVDDFIYVWLLLSHLGLILAIGRLTRSHPYGVNWGRQCVLQGLLSSIQILIWCGKSACIPSLLLNRVTNLRSLQLSIVIVLGGIDTVCNALSICPSIVHRRFRRINALLCGSLSSWDCLSGRKEPSDILPRSSVWFLVWINVRELLLILASGSDPLRSRLKHAACSCWLTLVSVCWGHLVLRLRTLGTTVAIV